MTILQKYIKSVTESKGSGRPDWRTDRSLVGTKICPFCGKAVRNPKIGYCRTCIKKGFDEVHKMFGTTNGWDKRPMRVMPVRNGWRGRRVSGGYAKIHHDS